MELDPAVIWCLFAWTIFNEGGLTQSFIRFSKMVELLFDFDFFFKRASVSFLKLSA